MKFITSKLLPFIAALIIAGCSSTPSKPDYRYEEQKQGADKAQEELSRTIKRGY